jgi:hypothetical protein
VSHNISYVSLNQSQVVAAQRDTRRDNMSHNGADGADGGSGGGDGANQEHEDNICAAQAGGGGDGGGGRIGPAINIYDML